MLKIWHLECLQNHVTTTKYTILDCWVIATAYLRYHDVFKPESPFLQNKSSKLPNILNYNGQSSLGEMDRKRIHEPAHIKMVPCNYERRIKLCRYLSTFD